MKGRKPGSPQMQVLTGTARKDRKRGKSVSEKDPSIKYGIKLDKLEAARFRRYKDYLVKKSCWKPVYSTLMAAFVRQETIARQASNDLTASDGSINLVEVSMKGSKVSAELMAWTISAKELFKMGEEFGFTPKAVRGVPELNGQLDLFKQEFDPFKKTG